MERQEVNTITDPLDRVIAIVRENCLKVAHELSGRQQPFCQGVFDGLYCWPDTLAGVLAEQPCNNEYIKSKNKTAFVSKQCTSNGSWYIGENRTRPWTNLNDCGTIYIELDQAGVDPIYGEWLPIIKGISYFGYTLSIVSSILALIIFIHIKRLHCERNKLHINLFISFILRAAMFLLKDVLFVNGTALSYETVYIDGQPNYSSSWICKAFISIRYYFIIANFTLIMMEGLYLHNLMFLNLFSESHATTIYCIIGWGLPLLFMIPWTVLRRLYDDTLCWTRHENKYIALFIGFPIGMTVVINFILFLIIVRILIVKLNFTSTFIQQRKMKYRKLLKSTLILIPIFGIPYVISLSISFYVDRSTILELVWLFFDQSFAAFQGFFATLLYCLLNSEVQTELRRKYYSLKDLNHKEFRRSRTISNNTQQSSIHANDETMENLHIFGLLNESTVKLKEREVFPILKDFGFSHKRFYNSKLTS